MKVKKVLDYLRIDPDEIERWRMVAGDLGDELFNHREEVINDFRTSLSGVVVTTPPTGWYKEALLNVCAAFAAQLRRADDSAFLAQQTTKIEGPAPKPYMPPSREQLAAEAKAWDIGEITPKGWVDAPEGLPNQSSWQALGEIRVPREMAVILVEFAYRNKVSLGVLVKRWLDDRIRQEAKQLGVETK